MEKTWRGMLESQLIKVYGDKKGSSLFKLYGQAFPISYADETDVTVAAEDIAQLENMSRENALTIKLYSSTENPDYPLHLRLYQYEKAIPLSVILPMLSNLDLRADSERPYKLTLVNGDHVWISDFSVAYMNAELNIDEIKDLFIDAFLNIYNGHAQNDGFNKLVLGASLSWREIIILRAYAKYLHQIQFRFSQHYIEHTLSAHPEITKDLINLFNALHNPALQKKSDSETIEASINKKLESVTSLDEDRILRRYMILILATLRTNYYQLDNDKKHKNYVSYKLSSRDIPDMPLPIPLYEIFVYSPDIEGIHLRNSKVARGGIRWSERPEDFRTEILGLMKAQVVKNAVIVPSGAKGGFVLKNLKSGATREEVGKEVVKGYTSFIKGLLDITDNIIDNKYVRPKDVVCRDDIDPYFVVAADKGTATFSDLANSISAEYNFWLGDAFASGGSAGYDHKKMGITARGAWESIKRHFREIDIDVMNSDITVVGIGDMAGDVFGNGMLYTNHIKLVAAFNHRNIFIDPNPNPEISYEERKRLFNLPGSTWDDYNSSLISKGGGIFLRSLKSITLTPEMKEVFDTDVNSATPNELIRIILKAPVELLYNGGIGTYVKSSMQSNADVGDRTNDYCRVDGSELRCKVVGEGGNLGFTQLGRIEFALTGGLINTDFIDNSAGVDCSDHEVNLKILLSSEINKGKLTLESRNTLLASLTQEVADLVLRDNYEQALTMSFTADAARRYISLHAVHIKELETAGLLDRRVEFIPDDKKLMERKAAAQGLTRPEIAVLLEYTKIHLKQSILQTNIADDPYISNIVENAFPPTIRQKYSREMREHRLFRDIVATQLSNRIINTMGITFIHRIHTETGSSIDELVRAYTVASHIFGTDKIRHLVEELDFKVPMSKQYEMLYNIRNLINLSTRWFLHSTLLKGDVKDLIDHYSSRIEILQSIIPTLMAGFTRKYLDDLIEDFLKSGLPRETAEAIATYRAIYTALNIIDVSTRYNFDLVKTAHVYFASGERVNMVWFRDQINHDSREGHWNALARLTLRDELDAAQRALTVSIMREDTKSTEAPDLISKWLDTNKDALKRWDNLLEMLHSSTSIEYSMFFIAVRELMSIIMRSTGAPRN
ncbi:MAG TPA: NAD-glutamate dehydrogenase domain-containing protein [Gammaproteobacteria bacterium]|jgi:glutamate dehydrogenase|nr:NAD-glutamate dehydrogenase domain-containing protein [Gammaproteobacteria bacterium]